MKFQNLIIYKLSTLYQVLKEIEKELYFNISEVNKNFNNKYDIPNNFKLINEFFVNGFMVYQVYQKN